MANKNSARTMPARSVEAILSLTENVTAQSQARWKREKLISSRFRVAGAQRLGECASKESSCTKSSQRSLRRVSRVGADLHRLAHRGRANRTTPSMVHCPRASPKRTDEM